MRLAKPHLDIGIFTNRLEPQLRFWQDVVGLPFEELLPTGPGNRQHRHSLNGSVFKLNASREIVPPAPLAGYRELLIARPGLARPRALVDPDGNPVTLVPPGFEGVTAIGVRLAVRSLDASAAYYREALEWEEESPGRFRCGDTLVLLHEDETQAEVGDFRACPGYRYMTVQVWDTGAEFARALAHGGREGMAPVTLGATARIAFVRDPDGNWLEISQRANLTGPLPP